MSEHHMSCSVPGCRNYAKKAARGTTFHSFPVSEEVQRAWVESFRRNANSEFEITPSSRVCSAHFKSSDFKLSTQSKRRYLLSRAVPSVFHLQPTTESPHINCTSQLTLSNEQQVVSTVTKQSLANDQHQGNDADQETTQDASTPGNKDTSNDAVLIEDGSALEMSGIKNRIKKRKHSSNKYCSVPQCKARTIKDKVSLHIFPVRDERLCAAWKYILCIAKPITKTMCACSEHFQEEDFITGGSRRLLRSTAVPSRNLPFKKAPRSQKKNATTNLKDAVTEAQYDVQVQCFIPGCPTGSAENENTTIALFRAPTDVELLHLWNRTIPYKRRALLSSDCVCEFHFLSHVVEREQEQIVNGLIVREPLERPVLIADAVPTIFPKLSPSYQSTFENFQYTEDMVEHSSETIPRPELPLHDEIAFVDALSTGVTFTDALASETGRRGKKATALPPMHEHCEDDQLSANIPTVPIGHDVRAAFRKMKETSVGKGSNSGVFCGAQKCYNRQGWHPNMTFFKFPAENNLCHLWLEMCGLRDLTIWQVRQSKTVLCAEHFEDTQFVDDKKWGLIRGAVPRIFGGKVVNIPPSFAYCLDDDVAAIIDGGVRKRCCIAGCCSKAGNGVEFFSFTSNAELREQWLEFVDNQQDKWFSDSFICEKHFRAGCITKDWKGRKRLNKLAVPYDCDIKRSNRQSNTTDIKRTKTNETTTLTCPCCCGETFHSRQDLRAHITQVARSIKCPVCDTLFCSLRSLAHHLIIRCEKPDEPSQSIVDENQNDSRKLLPNAAVNANNNDTSPPDTDSIVQSHQSTRSLTCSICDRTFSKWSHVAAHRRRVHKLPLKRQSKGKQEKSKIKIRKSAYKQEKRVSADLTLQTCSRYITESTVSLTTSDSRSQSVAAMHASTSVQLQCHQSTDSLTCSVSDGTSLTVYQKCPTRTYKKRHKTEQVNVNQSENGEVSSRVHDQTACRADMSISN